MVQISPKILLGSLPHLRGQRHHGDEVWYGEKSQGYILDDPYQFDLRQCSDDAEAWEHVLEFIGHLCAEYVVQAHKTEVPLAHQGGG